jgi:hypothetical protein
MGTRANEKMSTRAQEHRGTSNLCLAACALALLLSGCSVVEFFTPSGPPSYQEIYAVYKQTALKHSTSADVLAAFGGAKNELLSESKTVIASAGRKKKGYKTWFNMVAFDENELIAKRRYVFIADERPKELFVEPWEGVDFGCQMVLPKEVLDEPYANENARRIAILKQVVKDTRKDTGEVGADNEVVGVGGMTAGQAIDALVARLSASPALAARLSEPEGLEFEHINLDKGRLRMTVEDDVATVKMLLGSFAKTKKISPRKRVEESPWRSLRMI